MWVLLSAFVVGAFLWSLEVLFAQKRSWKAFAAKYKLNYEQAKLLSSPVVSGIYNELRINVYSEEQPSPDSRGVRFRSVVEVMGPGSMPMSGVVASGDSLISLASELDLPEQCVPAAGLWSSAFLAKTDDKGAMMDFLNDARVESLHRLMKNDKSSFMLIFDREDILLRYETGDPLHDPRRLDRLVRLMVNILGSLDYVREAKPAGQKKTTKGGTKAKKSSAKKSSAARKKTEDGKDQPAT